MPRALLNVIWSSYTFLSFKWNNKRSFCSADKELKNEGPKTSDNNIFDFVDLLKWKLPRRRCTLKGQVKLPLECATYMNLPETETEISGIHVCRNWINWPGGHFSTKVWIFLKVARVNSLQCHVISRNRWPFSDMYIKGCITKLPRNESFLEDK